MESLKPLEGIFSAVPTFFDDDEAVDVSALLQLMAWQLKPHHLDQFLPKSLDAHLSDAHLGNHLSQGVQGLGDSVSGFVLYGTTGEAPCLSASEKEQITSLAKEHFPQSVMIAGIGTNSTKSTIENAQQARDWGADAGLLVTPYYNRPSQEGLYQHCLKVAESVADWPLVLYVVPSRTGITLEIETVDRLLSACPQIISIKDASADLSYCAELIACCEGRATVLSGDDPTALASWAIGARGSISVGSNLFPAEMMRLWKLFNQGALAEAQKLFMKLHPLIRALFIETNPSPLKAALAQLSQQGLLAKVSPLNPSVRLPLSQLQSESQDSLIKALHQYLIQP